MLSYFILWWASWFSKMVSKPFIMLACHPLARTDYRQMEIIDEILESHLCCHTSQESVINSPISLERTRSGEWVAHLYLQRGI